MNKYLGDPSPQSARAIRERLAKVEREALMIEAAKKAIAVREHISRLRELRLAKEAQEVRTEIAKSPKKKPKKILLMTVRKCRCGAVYDRTEHVAVRREIESFECQFCGFTLESWNSAVVPRFKFLVGPVPGNEK